MESVSLIFWRSRSGRHTELRFVIGIPRQILRVVERDIEHEPDQEEGTAALDYLQDADIDGPTADPFDQGQYDMPAIKNRDWQKIDHRQVHIEDHAEPERELPAKIAVKQAIVRLHDHDRTAHMLKFNIGLR